VKNGGTKDRRGFVAKTVIRPKHDLSRQLQTRCWFRIAQLRCRGSSDRPFMRYDSPGWAGKAYCDVSGTIGQGCGDQNTY
jgi:hypothetical protein